jgi:hypothetical protein
MNEDSLTMQFPYLSKAVCVDSIIAPMQDVQAMATFLVSGDFFGILGD